MPRVVAVFVALCALGALAAATAPTSAASTTSALTTAAQAAPPAPPAPQPPAPPPPRAWIAVDADTGAVVDAGNHREPRRVASLIKVLTALVIDDHVRADAVVEVSPRAEAMPARRLALKAGETWQADHLLHALLLVSANDAAVALAEQAAGTLEDFGAAFAESAERLGFADDPVLQDPAGLDDEFSVGGGNLVSARDLAVATRAFLARPELVAIVGLPELRFVGGDEEPHVLRNHNRMLRLYPGAVGVKTGYTKRSGHSLIAAARRDGRTAIAVVVSAAAPYHSAALLLDHVFSVPPSQQGRLERLPAVPARAATARTRGPAAADRAAAADHATAAADAEADGADAGRAESGVGPLSSRDAVVLVAGTLPALAILARRRRQSRRSDPMDVFRI